MCAQDDDDTEASEPVLPMEDMKRLVSTITQYYAII
jgi:hypothetical protein